MHLSVDVGGNRLPVLRAPNWAAGVAVVLVSYGVGRALYNPRAGLWIAALVASSAPMIDFSVIARGYMLGIFFVVSALWLAALAINGARIWPWPLFAVAGALAFWSVPTMAVGMATVGVWAGAVLVLRRRWGALGALVIASAAAGVIAYLLYRPTLDQQGWDVPNEVPRDASAIWLLAKATWGNWQRAVPWPVELLFAAAVLAGAVLHRRIARQPVPILAAVALVIGVALVTGVGAGQFPRFWLVCLPFFLISAGAGLELATRSIARRRRAPAVPVAVAAVLAGLVLAAGQGGAEEPPTGDNQISGYLKHDLQAGEVLAHPYTFAPAVDYYLLRDGFTLTTGSVTGPMRKTGRAIVVAPGHDELPALDAVRFGGGVPGRAELLRRFEAMSVWSVEVRDQ
jgi:4-amino-4-deoxy-L-arabinose transferase-like glycosyltransferase